MFHCTRLFHRVILALMDYSGRPRREADLDWGTTDPAQFYYDRFYTACRTLDYSDCKALAYALDTSLRAVYFWRYGRCFPRELGVALTVMDWVAAGKPTKLVSQRQLLRKIL